MSKQSNKNEELPLEQQVQEGVPTAELSESKPVADSGTTTGKLIQMARIRAKYSLEKLSKVTCIRLKYLQAIEDDNFGVIPEKVAARGFVKICCDALGLNSALVLEQYNQEHDIPEVPKSASIQKLAPVQDPNMKYIWMAILAIGFIVLAFLIFRPSRSTTQSPPPVVEVATEEGTNSVSNAGEVVLGESRPPQREVKQEVKASANEVYAKMPVVVVGDNVEAPKKKDIQRKQQAKLTIRAVQDAWINVSIDGVDAYRNMLFKGETKTWFGKKTISVRSPNPADIKIIYNDKDLGNLSTENKITEKTFQNE